MQVPQASASPTFTENFVQESKILAPLPIDYVINEVSLNQLYAQVIQEGECLRKEPTAVNRQKLLEVLKPVINMSLQHMNDPQENEASKILLRAMFYAEVQSLLNTSIAAEDVMPKWDQILKRMQTNQF